MTIWLRSTASTMQDAAALAERGEPHGTVVVAECQTAGIGRHGHAWHSEDTGGLYASIVLRILRPANELPSLTMALGLAVQRVVDDVTDLKADIRWPNDVMLNGRKIAGVIMQMPSPGVLIAGIGLNVNQASFPEDIAAIATSLRIETGRESDKEPLLDFLVAEVLRAAHMPLVDILAEFERRSTWARGKQVIVEGTLKGITAGLDSNGFLLVDTGTKIETILSGGVREVAG